MRVLVIGAGPMGIAAAIGAADRGAEVTVLERGEIGASLRTWGATRFFSPLHMNVSPRMRELLGDAMPDPDALLTMGPEDRAALQQLLGKYAQAEQRVLEHEGGA
jgi:glycine/D-amino acid oxidase-like deaminating enzyme